MADGTVWADGGGTGCTTPGNAYGSTDGTFTQDTGKTSWTAEWTMGNPPSGISTGADEQSISVVARKQASDGGAPTIDSITVKDGATTLATFSTGWGVNTDGTATTIGPLTWTGTGTEDETNVSVQVVTTGNGGGPNERCIQLDSIAWAYTLAPVSTNADAVTADESATAYDATTLTTSNAEAGSAAVTATAYDATVTVTVDPDAESASVTATVYDATTLTTSNADAGVAAVTATAYDATVTVTSSAPAELVVVTATAYDATVDTAVPAPSPQPVVTLAYAGTAYALSRR